MSATRVIAPDRAEYREQGGVPAVTCQICRVHEATAFATIGYLQLAICRSDLKRARAVLKELLKVVEPRHPKGTRRD